MNLQDPFTKAYLMAALWTFDGDAPCGEYSTSGRFELLFPRIVPESLKAAIEDCKRFQEENREDLKQVGDDSQNGHDFWLTRNHHGAGFWDRGYPEELGDRLTKAAEKTGERELYCGDDGKIYLF